MLEGGDVSIADVCEAVADDEGVTPEDLTRALSLVPPATFAKGASYLKQYIRLPSPGEWVKKIIRRCQRKSSRMTPTAHPLS
jgi:hypothetical protein